MMFGGFDTISIEIDIIKGWQAGVETEIAYYDFGSCTWFIDDEAGRDKSRRFEIATIKEG